MTTESTLWPVLVKPHALYTSLGPSEAQRCTAYRSLFADSVDATTLESIREATNKAWVLGNDRFRDEVESLVKRQATPKTRGGDRKSVVYLGQRKINRV